MVLFLRESRSNARDIFQSYYFQCPPIKKNHFEISVPCSKFCNTDGRHFFLFSIIIVAVSGRVVPSLLCLKILLSFSEVMKPKSYGAVYVRVEARSWLVVLVKACSAGFIADAVDL